MDNDKIIRDVRGKYPEITAHLSHGSERHEHIRDIKLGPIVVGERARVVNRGEDLNTVLGAALLAGYEQARIDLQAAQTDIQGEQ